MASGDMAPPDLSVRDRPTSFRAVFTLCDETTLHQPREVKVEFQIPADESPLAVMASKALEEFQLGDVRLTFTTPSGEDGDVPLQTDGAVMEVLQRLRGDSADSADTVEVSITVARVRKVVTVVQPVAARPSAGGEELELQFEYTIDQTNVLEALKQEVRGEFELGPEPLSLVATVDDEAVKLVSDSTLAGVLDHCRQQREPPGEDGAPKPLPTLRVEYSSAPAVNSVEREVTVNATLKGDIMAAQHEIGFKFTVGQDGGVLQALRTECREELELGDAALALFVFVHGEGDMLLGADADFIAAVDQHCADGQPLCVTVEPRRQVTRQSVMFVVRGGAVADDDQDGEIAFAFAPDQPNLLDAVMQELRGELELMQGGFSVAAMVDDEAVPLTTDKQMLDVLTHCITNRPDPEVTGKLTVVLDPCALHSSVATRAVTINVSFVGGVAPDVSAAVVFRFDTDANGLLRDVLREISAGLDLEEVLEPATGNLDVKADGEWIPVGSDGALREVLVGAVTAAQEMGHPAEIEATVQRAAKRVVMRVPFFTIHEGERVEYALTISPAEDRQALQALQMLVADTLDYDEPSALRLAFVDTESSELVPIATDNAVLELAIRHREGGTETGSTELRVASDGNAISESMHAGAASVFARVQVTVHVAHATLGDEAEFVFVFDVSQPALLIDFTREIRGELEIFDERPLDIAVAVAAADGAAAETVPLQSDKALADALVEAARQGTPAHIQVTDARRTAPPRKVQVQCKYAEGSGPAEDQGEVAEFEFEFRVDSDGLHSDFIRACADALDCEEGDACLSLAVVLEEGESVVIASDRQLSELLLYGPAAEQDAALEVVLAVDTAKVDRGGDKVVNVVVGEAAPIRVILPLPEGHCPLEALRDAVRQVIGVAPGDEHPLLVSLANGEAGAVRDPETAAKAFDVALAEGIDICIEARAGSPSPAGTPVTAALVPAPPKEGTASSSPRTRAGERVVLPVTATCNGATVSFDFAFDVGGRGTVDALHRLVVESIPNAPEHLTLRAHTEDAPQDPFELSDDDELLGAVQAGYRGTLHVLASPSNGPRSAATARVAELRALCAEWRDVLEDGDSVSVGDMRPVITTFVPPSFSALGGEQPDPLQEHYQDHAATAARIPMPWADLQPTLERWTTHYGDDDLFAFCYHCRNTLDFLVGVSPAASFRRSVAVSWRAHSAGGCVDKELLRGTLKQSGAIADVDDVDAALDGYPGNMREHHFVEVMGHFFADQPHLVYSVFSVAQTQRPGTGAGSARKRGATRVDDLRRERLRSDQRHAMDAVSPVELSLFAQARHPSDMAPYLSDLAQCLAMLLAANVPRLNPEAAWAWFAAAAGSPEGAEQLERQLRATEESAASKESVTAVHGLLSQKELHPSRLLVVGGAPAGLSRWCTATAQLTAVTCAWPWPPIEPHPPQHWPHSSPTKVATSPPRRRAMDEADQQHGISGALTTATSTRGGTYQFKFRVPSMALADPPMKDPTWAEGKGSPAAPSAALQTAVQPTNTVPAIEQPPTASSEDPGAAAVAPAAPSPSSAQQEANAAAPPEGEY